MVQLSPCERAHPECKVHCQGIPESTSPVLCQGQTNGVPEAHQNDRRYGAFTNSFVPHLMMFGGGRVLVLSLTSQTRVRFWPARLCWYRMFVGAIKLVRRQSTAL